MLDGCVQMGNYLDDNGNSVIYTLSKTTMVLGNIDRQQTVSRGGTGDSRQCEEVGQLADCVVWQLTADSVQCVEV